MSNLERAMELWIQLTEVDPSVKHISGNQMDIYFQNKELEEALSLEPEGLIFTGLMQDFAEQFFSSRSISLTDIMDKPEDLKETMEKCKELRVLLKDMDVTKQYEQIANAMRKAIQTLHVESETIQEKLKDQAWLAALRRDALKSNKALNLHQVTAGKATSDQATLFDNIYAFRNVNSLVATLQESSDGISLSVVQQDYSWEVYFAIGIKNGGNLYILTDAPRYVHPMQKDMIRRPDRVYEERVGGNRFPYFLAEQVADLFDNSCTHELAMVQKGFLFPIGKLHLLPDETLTWLLMLYSILDQTYFKQKKQLPELSYLSSMIMDPKISLEMSKVPMVQGYQVLEMEKNTVESLKHDTQYKNKLTPWAKWAEETYGPEIDQSLLNSMMDGSTIQLLPKLIGGDTEKIDIRSYTSASMWDKRDWDSRRLFHLSGNVLDTKEHLEENYRWCARFNEAKMINQLVQEDFKQHRDGILQWASEAAHKNASTLMKKLINEEFSEHVQVSTEDKYRIVQSGMELYQGQGFSQKNTRCFFTGKPGTYIAAFTPQDAEGIKEILGIDTLPELIKTWTRADTYVGNPILERLDPMSWVVKNPWKDLTFIVEIHFSKTYWNQLVKENPNHTFELKK